MKRLLSHSLALFLVTFGMSVLCEAQVQTDQGSQAQWEIESVSVYQSGALVTRSSTWVLDESGKALIRIGGLSTCVDAGSVQIKLPSGWSLSGHSFEHSPRAIVDESFAGSLEESEVSLKTTKRILAMRNSLLDVYSEELLMIQANRKAGGSELLLVEDLIDLSNFWRSRVKELEYLMLDLRLEMEDLQEEIDNLTKQRDEVLRAMNTEEGQITLRVVGPKKSSGRVQVSYIVPDALWRTVYDAEVSDEGLVTLRRYAEVIQNTGVNWSDLQLDFFVGNPLKTLSPPAPFPLEVSLDRSNAEAQKYGTARMNSMAPMAKPFSVVTHDAEVSVPQLENTSALRRGVYRSSLPARVSGNGTPERIFLETLNMQSELTYLMMPEYADEAFQRVLTEDWNQAELQPGTVQVVAGGVYRGLYDLILPAPGDSLEIPLGQDARIRSSRKPLLERCSSSVLGGSKRKVQAFQIDIVNQHNRPVRVRVLDRIPISRNSDITVTIQDLDGGVIDPITGWVTWEVDLAPLAQKTRSFSYKIEYPKKYSLQGL